MKVATVNISFPKPLLKAIDRAAEREFRSRSELLREAGRMYLERRERGAQIFSFWSREAEKKKISPKDVEDAIRQVRSKKK